jgi:phage-related minor tail protein
MNIGQLFMELVADGAKLEPSVVKEAQKAGDAGAKTLGARLSAGLKTQGVKAFGIAAAGAFALATRGALELEEVQARYRAETGATAGEAVAAGEAINRIAGDQRQSLEAVSEAAIRVRKDLGATGDAADALTESFVEYARVTRQDAAEAVSDFDDILDSWGLTAADAAGLMDKLLVSNQKWGGSLADNQKTLAALAPSLRAANFEIDDGIALLNLFGAKGLNAESASAAFAKALTKVKSPAELERLIDDISATQDPFERAAKAADLFGAKAGAKLANALGGANLDDYRVDVEDATGAVQEAADVLDSTFGAQIQKKISQVKALIRGFGSDFGPALTGAAALASLMSSLGLGKPLIGAVSGAWRGVAKSALVTRAIALAGGKAASLYLAALIAGDKVGALASGLATNLATAINKVPGVAAVKGAILATGAKIGTALGVSAGTAFAAAFAAAAAAAVAAVALVALDQQGKIDAQGEKLLARAREWSQVASDTALADSIAATREQLDKIPGNAFDAKNKVIAVLNTLIAEQNRRATEGGRSGGRSFGSSWAEGAESSAPKVEKALDHLMESASVQDLLADQAHAAGNRAGEALAQGILDAREKPVNAFDKLVEMLKHPLRRGKEQARLLGQLTSKELAKGLRSSDPAIRAQAQATKQYIIDRLTELKTGSGKLSKEQAALVNKGLRSKDPDIRAAAQRIKNYVETPLTQARDQAYGWGQGVGDNYAAGIRNRIVAVQRAARLLAKKASDILRLGSPAKEGPLSEKGGPEGWGARFSDLYAAGVRSGMPEVNRALAGLAFSGPAMVAPRVTATGAPGATAGSAGSSAALTVNGGLHLHGVGSDVSPAAARRFGQSVLDEVAIGLREQSARYATRRTA